MIYRFEKWWVSIANCSIRTGYSRIHHEISHICVCMLCFAILCYAMQRNARQGKAAHACMYIYIYTHNSWVTSLRTINYQLRCTPYYLGKIPNKYVYMCTNSGCILGIFNLTYLQLVSIFIYDQYLFLWLTSQLCNMPIIIPLWLSQWNVFLGIPTMSQPSK